MTSHGQPKKIRLVLISVIVVLIGLILLVFIKNRIRTTKTHPPPSPESTGADLTIKRFRHIATRDGIRQWSLEAASASLFSKKNKAQLSDISATFYLKKNQTISLNADKGILDMQTNDMAITGHIAAKLPEYTLKTESLHYDHRLHIIKTNTPVTVTGPRVSLKADTMTYNLKTGVIRCAGHVEGKLSELAEK